ncbi:hypothetical protein Patl1_31590 [Pistacia atlantica]|uniref:Uncharacterized protein n=1 Tax=Pistacia atlantica TaxID=434234 RepID=A0ACC1APM5_9ROSI|nr:hypothetical protein Patl1_31590 [Pistacia atlantica]
MIPRWRFCLIGIILVLLSCHFLQLATAQITHPLEVKALQAVRQALTDTGKNLNSWKKMAISTSKNCKRLLNMKLSEKLAPALGLFSHMTVLDLSSNQLTRSIPTNKLANNITTIDLANNMLTGPIPSNFSGFTILQRLDFQNNSLTNVSGTIDPPSNVTIRRGNPVCTSANEFCGPNIGDDEVSGTSNNTSNPTCHPQSCPASLHMEYVPESHASCFCALPLGVDVRLRSPSISDFPPYKHAFGLSSSISGLRILVDYYLLITIINDLPKSITHFHVILKDQKWGMSKGAVIGIVLGSIVGLIAISLVMLFIFYKRKSKHKQELAPVPSDSGGEGHVFTVVRGTPVNSACQSGMMYFVIDNGMGPYSSECLRRFMALALKCCEDETKRRPSMLEVVRELEKLSSMLPESETIPTDSYISASGSSGIPTSSLYSERNSYVSGGFPEGGSDLVSGVVPTIRPR